MKNIKSRYILKGRNLPVEKREEKELVLAEVSAGFVTNVDGNRGYQKFQVSLESKVKLSHFGAAETNFKFDRAIFDRHASQNGGLRARMSNLERGLSETENHFVINGTLPSAQEFKKELMMRLGRSERAVNVRKSIPTVAEFLAKKILMDEERSDSHRKDKIKENSIKSYRTLLRYVQNYDHYRAKPLRFSELDNDVWWDFWNVQDDILKGIVKVPQPEGKRKQTVKKDGFMVNSIKKYQMTLSKVLRLAKKEAIEVALDISDSNLILKERPSHKNIYVDEKQLLKIFNTKPSNELQEAYDYVVLASLTGMRFQSMEEASSKSVEYCQDGKYDFQYIHSTQGKTDTECIIPLCKPALEVIERHGGKFPKFSPNSIVNESLKELFKIFEVTVEEAIYPYRGKSYVQKRNMNELISTHDFRKSFYTNLTLLKVQESVIDGITHPDKARPNAMAEVYNKATMLDRAKLFVDELKKIDSQVYSI